MYLVMMSLFFSDMKSLRLGLSTLDNNEKNDARKITHTVILKYFNIKESALSNFTFQSF